MGFDIFGTMPQNSKGEYFRNNIWWWSTTWDFVSEICQDFLTIDQIDNGYMNNLYGYPEETAIKIAEKIDEAIKDKRAEKYKKQCKKQERNFTIRNLKDFKEFAENSGGFTIG